MAVGGEQALSKLHRDYPGLFGASMDADKFERQLETTHRNTIEVAYNNAEAWIENGTGSPSTGQGTV